MWLGQRALANKRNYAMNSLIMKIAHKLAKSNQAKMGGSYSIYLSLALKATHKLAKKGIAKLEGAAAFMNGQLKQKGESLITYTSSCNASHGVQIVRKTTLKAGEWFGKTWIENGERVATVYSKSEIVRAY